MKDFIQDLTGKLRKDQISFSEKVLLAHAKDQSFHMPSKPDCVVFPETTNDVKTVLIFANKNHIPVTAWGGGSSLEGNPIPVKQGIVMDMTRMNKVLKIYQEDLQVMVQPGIIGEALNKKLAKHGLFFPAFPGSASAATIGGMIANNAGGMFAVKYGVVGDWVLQLEVVLADGTIIKTGGRSFKSVSGYDLKRIFIGSEGTLGIITNATLKLAPIPKTKIALLISFPSVAECSKGAQLLLHSWLNPSAIEFMDSVYIHYVNKIKNAGLPEKPSLIIEFHGEKNEVEYNISRTKKLLQTLKPQKSMSFRSAAELGAIWEYRRALRPVLGKFMPDMAVLSAEVGMPISEVMGFLKKANELSKKYHLQTVMFGHMGDGNFHGWALYKKNSIKEWKTVKKLNDLLIKYAIAHDGTTTGEHGLGIGKRKYLGLEHPTTLVLMKKLKKLFDPNGILNPEKFFPN